jgi:SAM-dependent methyltransferase
LFNDVAVVGSLSRYELEKIAVPTLVISAADDLFGTYAMGQYTAAHIPGARFVGYPSGGHMWVGRHAQLVSEITGFLGGLPGAVHAPPAHGQTPGTHQHRFGDAEKWSHVFDDPQRDEWQKPHQVIQALALEPDALVADIGAGTGYFSARLANRLRGGKVYAVDIEPDMVRYLSERAKREALANMVAVAGAPGDPRLPAKVDLVLLVDVYHHIDERPRYLGKLRGSLKPGGRVAVIDFRLDSPEGPPKEARIAPERVKSEMAKAGYVLAKEHGFLPRQYFLVFEPAAR